MTAPRTSSRQGRRLVTAATAGVTGLLLAGLLPASAAAAGYARTVQVNLSSTGGPANIDGNGTLESPAISASGRYVAFVTYSTNLVPGDTNATSDVFLRDVAAGTTRRVSVSSTGVQGNGESGGGGPAISGDGRYVAFTSAASNLVPADTNGAWDVFVHEVANGKTRRVNVSGAGDQANGHSFDLAMSPDGRHVAFFSYADNLVPADTNDAQDVFVHNIATGRTRRVSVSSTGAQATNNRISTGIALSSGGRHITFDSDATNLVPADTNGTSDVFVRDMAAGTTRRVSVSSTGTQANGHSWRPTITADGRRIAFESTATNLTPAGATGGAFVRDMATSKTRQVADGSWAPAISADGRRIAFSSSSASLVPGDTNGYDDVFVRDMATGKIRRVSVSSTGAEANYGGLIPAISANGRHVAFLSSASNLVPNDTASSYNVFLRHLAG